MHLLKAIKHINQTTAPARIELRRRDAAGPIMAWAVMPMGQYKWLAPEGAEIVAHDKSELTVTDDRNITLYWDDDYIDWLDEILVDV